MKMLRKIPLEERNLKEGEFYFYTSSSGLMPKQPPTSIVLLVKILDAKWGNKYYRFFNFVCGQCYDHYHIGGITKIGGLTEET